MSSNFHQSEAIKQCFLASNLMEFGTLPELYKHFEYQQKYTIYMYV